MNMTGFLWCGGAALASALASLLIKFSNQAGSDWNVARLTWLGAACATYALGFVSYTVALQKLDMSLAYPIMTGIAIAFVALIGYVALNEAITPAKIAGMVLVAAGAFLLSR
jgi:multidrug transporter EmrE-like cation transporter